MRRTTVAALLVFVLLGLLNVFGSRVERVVGRSGDVVAAVDYPAATRGGLPTSWSVTVTNEAGAALGDVAIRTTGDFLDTFDHNDLVPPPDRFEQDAHRGTWHFDDLTASQIVVRLDMRTQPDARWRQRTATEIEVGGERIDLAYTTWVLP